MRIILDTNLLVSALLNRGTPPRQLYDRWRQGRFALVSCEAQLLELRAVLERPSFSGRIKKSEAGSMVNGIRRLALMYPSTPAPEVSTDPSDDYLLGLAETSQADFLVTGDKGHLLRLRCHGATRILTARELITLLGG